MKLLGRFAILAMAFLMSVQAGDVTAAHKPEHDLKQAGEHKSGGGAPESKDETKVAGEHGTPEHKPSGAATTTPSTTGTPSPAAAPSTVDFKKCADIKVTDLNATVCQNVEFTASCMKHINMTNAPEECIKEIPDKVLAELDPKTVNEIGAGQHAPLKEPFVALYLKHVNAEKYSEAYFTRLVENNDVLNSLFKSKIPPTELASIFTADTVEKINVNYCENFTADLFKNMKNKAFSKVPPECLGKVKAEAFKGMSGGFLSEINPAAFKNVTIDQIKAIGLFQKFEVTVDQMKNLGPDVVFTDTPSNASDEEKARIKKENAELAKNHPCLAIGNFVVKLTEKSKAFKERCGPIIKRTSSALSMNISWMVLVPTVLLLVIQSII